MFKNSGKLKLQPRKRLLHNQPALLTAFTGFLSSEHNNEKKNHATVTGIVNKLKPYQFYVQWLHI